MAQHEAMAHHGDRPIPYAGRFRMSWRVQDSNFRQILGLTTLLLKIKGYERQMEVLEETAALHDIAEIKGVSCLE